MATRSTGLPDFFADTTSSEKLRRQFIEAPLEGARQEMIGSALELAKFLTILPDAFVASQGRELERLQRWADNKDPRVVALKQSIEGANTLRATARKGQLRVERALIAVADREPVFHGFVSSQALGPLKGATVRLVGDKATRQNALSAVTDAEGYFKIALGRSSAAPRDPETRPPINFSERFNEVLNRLGGAGRETPAVGTAAPDARQTELLHVEIVRKGQPNFIDPTPVEFDGGSFYREYVISEKEPSERDWEDFVSQPDKSKAPTTPGTSTTPTTPTAATPKETTPPGRPSAPTSRGAVTPSPFSLTGEEPAASKRPTKAKKKATRSTKRSTKSKK